MIITDNIKAILVVTGVVTASPILQFLSPALGLKLLFKLGVPPGAGGFFARHWGLIVGGFGALLVYAAYHPELRAPLMLVALIEKAGLVTLIALDWSKPHTAGLRLSAAFDATCVLVYGAYLLHLA
jgi:hypothetical protein